MEETSEKSSDLWAGLALAYVRVSVPEDAALEVGGAPARLHWPTGRP